MATNNDCSENSALLSHSYPWGPGSIRQTIEPSKFALSRREEKKKKTDYI